MSRVDLRCENNLYGRLTDNRWLEVKCKRRACGYRKGVVILHTIDIETGEVVRTKKFSAPPNPLPKKESQHAADNSPASVRSA